MQFDVDGIFAERTDVFVHAHALIFDFDALSGVAFTDQTFGNGPEKMSVRWR